jgi:hypothetical protein
MDGRSRHRFDRPTLKQSLLRGTPEQQTGLIAYLPWKSESARHPLRFGQALGKVSLGLRAPPSTGLFST